MFLFSDSVDSCRLPILGLIFFSFFFSFETYLILHPSLALNSMYPRLVQTHGNLSSSLSQVLGFQA